MTTRPPNENGGAGTPGASDLAARMRRRADYIEEQLNAARDRGDFDNLRGTGQPLQLDKNPYAGDRALAYSLLKNNQLAPPEIERGKEIDADLARADALPRALRRQRDALHTSRAVFASERRAYNIVRDKTARRYAEQLRTINSTILSLNIIAPAALSRPLLDVDRRLAAFEDEFPRVAE